GVNKVFHRLTGTTDYGKAPENMKKTLENMLSSDKKLDISTVTTKTNIIWGEKDNITPPRQARKLEERMPNATLEFFPEWNHAPYIKQPKELANAIERIINKIK
ncbi:alpha/beta hydrolase, partial [Candidatus Saccharibacteria bacterium]|nr:alpha/beta hydrolase [Candidatus Saccharibacteria bacterium]